MNKSQNVDDFQSSLLNLLNDFFSERDLFEDRSIGLDTVFFHGEDSLLASSILDGDSLVWMVGT